ncbi:MAG: thiamine pyrophosphate-binding protein [Deltaproteobacteria bacterium]|nr:thiamine pyrophosphate-binding protein [Deltaproteobacteria bacterium]
MNTGTVALQILQELRAFGVDRVFGIPGGAVGGLYAALDHTPDIAVVHAKHETGAAFMALGYALATGRPGVVFTTAGPGITNAITGIMSAYYEGVPVIHIAGEVSRAAFGRGALQESSASAWDAVAIASRFTKFSAQISRSASAVALVRKALSMAYSGRKGPAFLSLPMDVANEPARHQPLAGNTGSSFDIDVAACHAAMECLERSRRPLILAGAGTRDFTSRRALRRLAEHLGAPVAVTTKGKSVFPEDHPLYLGLFGFGGHDSVTEYLASGVDALMVIGSGLNDFSTNAWSPLLAAPRAFIQVDIDPVQLGKNYPLTHGLLGPIDAVLSRMLEHRTGEQPKLQYKVKPQYQAVQASAQGALTTAQVVQAINELTPSNSLYTADMGEHLAVVLHHLRVRDDGDFITCLGFGAMGSSIGTAIGYLLGAPQRTGYAICGDGCFLMQGTELATAVQHRVPLTFVVINDSRLNMVHHGQAAIYNSKMDFSTQEVDFAAWAKSMGAQGSVIRTEADLRHALAQPVAEPTVLDVRVDPDVRLAGSQRLAALKQFQSSPANDR